MAAAATYLVLYSWTQQPSDHIRLSTFNCTSSSCCLPDRLLRTTSCTANEQISILANYSSRSIHHGHEDIESRMACCMHIYSINDVRSSVCLSMWGCPCLSSGGQDTLHLPNVTQASSQRCFASSYHKRTPLLTTSKSPFLPIRIWSCWLVGNLRSAPTGLVFATSGTDQRHAAHYEARPRPPQLLTSSFNPSCSFPA